MELVVIAGPACAATLKEGAEKRISELSKKPFKLTLWKDIKFCDGEFLPQIMENVRGADVYIIQSTNSPESNFKYLKLLLNAVARASADSLTAVIPYMGGLRQDKKDRPRVAITAKENAKEIEAAMGATPRKHAIILHPHFPQIQGFFEIPVDLIYPTEIFCRHLEIRIGGDLSKLEPLAADAGGAKLASIFAKRLNCDTFAMADKRRDKDDHAYIRDIIGFVSGRTLLIPEDMISTAGTIIKVVLKLDEISAEQNDIYICATHGIFAEKAIENLMEAGIKQIFITDSINHEKSNLPSNFIEIVSAGELIGETIYRNHTHQSISEIDGMFNTSPIE
ncbi:MAG: ribose-phosphate diphosphokinase [Patescibacteria group bacterium]|nr:ribose-phosphate diphosphokinase [Patescibacteria group bacterium]